MHFTGERFILPLSLFFLVCRFDEDSSELSKCPTPFQRSCPSHSQAHWTIDIPKRWKQFSWKQLHSISSSGNYCPVLPLLDYRAHLANVLICRNLIKKQFFKEQLEKFGNSMLSCGISVPLNKTLYF